jgi:outer membrane immunogenic protein
VSNRVLSSLFGAAFILSASGSAFAADMATKAPPPAPAPVYNWTGWYAGVNVGASFGHVKTDFNAAPVTVTSGLSSVIVPGFAGSNTEYPDGFMGGGQIGYNWQLSPIWVVGLEADFQGALEKDTNTLTNAFDIPSAPIISTITGLPTGATTSLIGTAVTSYSTKIDWFGTVRARLGYLWGDGKVLTYVTGGLAYARVDLEGTSTVSGTAGGAPFSITHAIGHSHVNAGWTVGYGMEGVLATPGWTWKVESLYMDFGHLNDTDAVACEAECPVTVAGGQTITHTHFTDAILRGGLNYKFH